MYKYEQYDRAAIQAMKDTGAIGIALIVVGGSEGDGISIRPLELSPGLPSLLRAAADYIEKYAVLPDLGTTGH